MYKKLISSFFLIVFVALISAPTVLNLVDDSVDTSAFYSLSEEEKGHETIKVLELFNSHPNVDLAIILSASKSDFNSFESKNYSKPFLNLVSPPPK